MSGIIKPMTRHLYGGYMGVENLIARWANRSMRKLLVNSEFSIISNNCWAGRVYRDLGLPYRTPFVGLFIYADCYLQMLSSLENYVKSALTFKANSRYEFANQWRRDRGIFYPIGCLAGEVELHFLHYGSEMEAREKWARRVSRINWNRLYVKFNDQNLCTENHIRRFANLTTCPKVVFTARQYSDIPCAVNFRRYQHCKFLPNDTDFYREYFDVCNWLNTGRIRAGHMFPPRGELTLQALLSVVLGRFYITCVTVRTAALARFQSIPETTALT